MNGWQNIINSAREAGYTGGDSDFAGIKAFIRRNFSDVRSDGRILDDAELKAIHDDWLNVKARELEDELLGGGGRKARTDTPDRQAARARGIDVGAGGHGGGFDSIEKMAEARGWVEAKAFHAAKVKGDPGPYSPDQEGWRLFLGDVANKHNPKSYARLEKYDTRTINKAQAGQTGALGGFLVPSVLLGELLADVEREFPLLGQRRSFVATHGNLSIPVEADGDRSSQEIAGFGMTRTGENAELDEDEVNFQQVSIVPTKAAKIVKVPRELIEDSGPMTNNALRLAFSRAIAMRQGEDYIRGTGAGAPTGLLVSGDRYEQAAEGSQPADTIKATNLWKMMSRVSRLRGSAWAAHPSTIPQLMTLFVQGKTDAGTNVAAGSVLFQQGGRDGEPDTLAGRPIYYSEHCSLVGDVGDLILTVPETYIYVLAGNGITIDVSEHAAFTADQVVYRVRMRDGGFPWRSATQRDARNWENANTVTLAAR